MKIRKRLASGWSKPVENKQREHCDTDGARLWLGPGDQVYCDLVHDLREVESRGVEAKERKEM